jgi:hypothetical protein
LRSIPQTPAVHVPTWQPAAVQVVGLVHVSRLTPLHVPAHEPVPVHAARGITGVPVTALHVPTRPGSAHASHCPLHAVSQHTPSTQLPERHCEPTEHVAPFARSLRQVFEHPSREIVLPSSHSSPGSSVPFPQPGALQLRTGKRHTPLDPTFDVVVRFKIAGVRELGRYTTDARSPPSKPACAGVQAPPGVNMSHRPFMLPRDACPTYQVSSL